MSAISRKFTFSVENLENFEKLELPQFSSHEKVTDLFEMLVTSSLESTCIWVLTLTQKITRVILVQRSDFLRVAC